MKLTKENIQFIDTYLQNSNVIYVDIRLEMTDHIATAVEDKMREENLDFYDAFKNYMAENKKEILKNNKSNITFTWTEIKTFFIFFVQPKMVLLGALLFLANKYVNINSYFSKDFTFDNLTFLLFLSIVLFQVFYYYVYLKKRYYRIEKSGQLLFLFYLLQPFLINKNNMFTVVSFYFLLGYILYFFKEIKSFQKHKYNFAF